MVTVVSEMATESRFTVNYSKEKKEVTKRFSFSLIITVIVSHIGCHISLRSTKGHMNAASQKIQKVRDELPPIRSAVSIYCSEGISGQTIAIPSRGRSSVTASVHRHLSSSFQVLNGTGVDAIMSPNLDTRIKSQAHKKKRT